MKFLVAGDLILAQPWSEETEPRFLRLIERIQAADLSVANLEVVLSGGVGYPQLDSGGIHLTAPGDLAAQIRWAGFDMVGHANNHAFDWGTPGLLKSIDNLNAAGLPNAGAGEDLPAARKPAFLRVGGQTAALVSMTTTLQRYARPERPRHGVSGRPGVNPLEIQTRRPLWTRVNTALCKGQDALGNAGIRWRGLEILKPDEQDVQANLAEIANARKQADYVLVSLHSHDRGAWRQRFAHQAVDAGADVVFMHGRHYVQGVEIYHQRPIFYCLGSAAMELQKFTHHPQAIYSHYSLSEEATGEDLTRRLKEAHQGPYYKNPRLWQGILGAFELDRGAVSNISLIPVDLGGNRQGEARGRPQWADPPLGKDILNQVARASGRYGTRIDIDGDPVSGTVIT